MSGKNTIFALPKGARGLARPLGAKKEADNQRDHPPSQNQQHSANEACPFISNISRLSPFSVVLDGRAESNRIRCPHRYAA